MTKCANGILCYENLVTYRAVLTFGKSCGGASRCNRFVAHLGVTKSSNGILCYENLITYRAVLTLGKSCGGASRSNRFVDHLGMTKNSNDILSDENLITNRTVLTLGKSCGGASRSNRFVDHLGMYAFQFSINTYIGGKSGIKQRIFSKRLLPNILIIIPTGKGIPVISRSLRKLDYFTTVCFNVSVHLSVNNKVNIELFSILASRETEQRKKNNR